MKPADMGRNMFWVAIETLFLTWLLIGSGLVASILLRNLYLWLIGVYQ